jgi:hypothetical protein
MRTKYFQFSQTITTAQTTTIYWPVDTHGAPDFGIGFAQSTGAGSITGASVAFTHFPILSKGTTSASFVAVTSAAAAVAGFSLLQTANPATCWRFAVSTSGPGTWEFSVTQYDSAGYP